MRMGGRRESGVRPLRVGGAVLGLLLFTLALAPRGAGPGTGGAPPVDNLTGQFLVATAYLGGTFRLGVVEALVERHFSHLGPVSVRRDREFRQP